MALPDTRFSTTGRPWAGILCNQKNPEVLASAVGDFIHHWGLDSARQLPFTSTYYETEMGSLTTKTLIMGSTLIDFNFLVEIKLWATRWEQTTQLDNKRLINIDPGIITPMGFWVSTYKQYAHRVPLGHGVYADLQAWRHKSKWVSLPWTYPDYQDIF